MNSDNKSTESQARNLKTTEGPEPTSTKKNMTVMTHEGKHTVFYWWAKQFVKNCACRRKNALKLKYKSNSVVCLVILKLPVFKCQIKVRNSEKVAT